MKVTTNNLRQSDCGRSNGGLPSPLLSPDEVRQNKKLKTSNENQQGAQFNLIEWSLANNHLIKSNYRPIRILGFGGYGVVVELKNKQTNKLVPFELIHMAIKVMERKESEPKEIYFAHLKHKNLVNIMEHFFDRRAYYLVMESFGTVWRPEYEVKPFYIDLLLASQDPTRGTTSTLFEYIEFNCHGKVPKRSQKSLFSQICQAIAYLHSHGVVHGDIKEENVLVARRSGRLIAKVCDFGHSVMVDDIPAFKCYGTKILNAPELLDEGERAYSGLEQDIWALGLLFFTLMHGQLPPENDDFIAMKYDLTLLKVYPTNFESIPDKDGKDLIKKLLSINFQDRPKASNILIHPFFRNNK
jgi:serine/threonine protein kinase